ncbi:unnamed protein product [Psylliodes chrysocephalus]|uniref:Uncharacterized protein n=1 Tax=Psylliodes chrysocephalus TaxID=3402493 RepID=A0A9P0CHP5_9CUCU|nr:unnamed protein product [Psylliodes chrysocephala]
MEIKNVELKQNTEELLHARRLQEMEVEMKEQELNMKKKMRSTKNNTFFIFKYILVCCNRIKLDSPPDRDSLEIISVAAATLSSILTTNDTISERNDIRKIISEELESPDDSGVCTETTSLDRSPSLEQNNCGCVGNSSSALCNCQTPNIKNAHNHIGTRVIPKSSFPIRKKNSGRTRNLQEEDSSSSGSSETSSFNSTCADDEEIAMALQAAELASKNEVRSKYKSSEDLLHRLFVCIAGVADQLQTNFACDLRNILKSVFLINATDTTETPLLKSVEPANPMENSIEYHPSENEVIENNEFSVDPNILAQEALFDSNIYFHLDSEDECPEYSNHPRPTQGDERSINSLSSDLNRNRGGYNPTPTVRQCRIAIQQNMNIRLQMAMDTGNCQISESEALDIVEVEESTLHFKNRKSRGS